MSIDDVTLRPLAESELPFVERFLADPEVSGPFNWFGWGDPGRFRQEWAENGMLGLDGGRLLVVRGDDRLGFVAWRKRAIIPASYYWSLAIGLLPEVRGKGVGTEAQRLLVRYLFAHTPVARIEADTETGNIAEQRALEKAGFTREGVRRSLIFRDGQWRDGVMYSVLRDEV